MDIGEEFRHELVYCLDLLVLGVLEAEELGLLRRPVPEDETLILRKTDHEVADVSLQEGLVAQDCAVIPPVALLFSDLLQKVFKFGALDNLALHETLKDALDFVVGYAVAALSGES